MEQLPSLKQLSESEKEALIIALWEENQRLKKRLGEVEGRLTERCISSLIFMLMPRLEHEPKQQRFQRLERNPPQASTGDETTGLETVPDCRRPGRHSCGCQPVGQLSLRQC